MRTKETASGRVPLRFRRLPGTPEQMEFDKTEFPQYHRYYSSARMRYGAKIHGYHQSMNAGGSLMGVREKKLKIWNVFLDEYREAVMEKFLIWNERGK
jgi:hypothetical protein